jgi:hypothetical protein
VGGWFFFLFSEDTAIQQKASRGLKSVPPGQVKMREWPCTKSQNGERFIQTMPAEGFFISKLK